MREHSGFSLQNTKVQALLAVVVLVVVVVATVLISGALGGGSDGNSAVAPGSFGNVTQAGIDNAIDGLCEVQVDFLQGDIAAARTPFYDKAHLFLHQMAAEVQEKDVTQATSLLVAKYKVENVILLPDNPPTPTSADGSPDALITDLLVQVKQSAAVLGFTAPDCAQ